MLVIRREQLAALNQPLEAAFLERLVGMANAEFPTLAAELGDAGLREHVRQLVARADAWGLITEQQTAFVAWLLLRCGAGFDDEPRFAPLRQVLQAAELSADEKLVLAQRRLPAAGLG